MRCLLRYHCSFPGCKNTSMGTESQCPTCRHIVCREHRRSPEHKCDTDDPSESRKIRAANRRDTLDETSAAHVVEEALKARPGHLCSVIIDPPSAEREKLRGQMNFHREIRFDDGVLWLARIRIQEGWTPPRDILDMVLRSEVATLAILHQSGLPVPKAYMPLDRQVTGDGRVPLEWFMMECTAGIPLVYFPNSFGQPLDTSQDTLIDDYARMQIRLSNIQFCAIGSPMLDRNRDSSSAKDGGESLLRVGPLLSFCHPDPPHFLGPFKTNRDRYLSEIDVCLRHILAGDILNDDPLFAYLAHVHVRHIVNTSEMLARKESIFYLRHDDSKSDSLMVEHGRLESIIDWQWAHATTKEEAFSRPLWLSRPTNELGPEEQRLMDAYERMGRPDLAECLANGHIYSRLREIIGEYPRMTSINNLATCPPCHENEGPRPPTREAEWIEWASREYWTSAGVQMMIAKEGPRQASRAAAKKQAIKNKRERLRDIGARQQDQPPEEAQ